MRRPRTWWRPLARTLAGARGLELVHGLGVVWLERRLGSAAGRPLERPEIRVRLSAQGEARVVAALQRVAALALEGSGDAPGPDSQDATTEASGRP